METILDQELPRSRLAVLLKHFARVDDGREPWRIAYPLTEMLLLVTCATIADCPSGERGGARSAPVLALPLEEGRAAQTPAWPVMRTTDATEWTKKTYTGCAKRRWTELPRTYREDIRCAIPLGNFQNPNDP